MEKVKKLFGEVDLRWIKLVLYAVLAGTYTAIVAMVPAVKDTSFSDLTVTFEVWIFFGIFIIMNSKSAKESALKCFVFFLISQPLVYLIQDVIQGSRLFLTYYRYWFMWTVATIPMGFVGYYMKKDKWWGLLILTPILLLLGEEYSRYLSKTIFSFPFHILTTIFCFITLIIYPLVIFKNKKIKIAGIIISIIIIAFMTFLVIIYPPVYSTDILTNGENYQFDESYKVYLIDSKFGDLSLRYEEAIETWMVHAEFKHSGKTVFVLESPDGEKKTFDIFIKRDTFTINEIDINEETKDETEINENENKKNENTWKTENISITIDEKTVTRTSTVIIIKDQNEIPKNWGLDFALQVSAGDDKWEDLIIKEIPTWNSIVMKPDEEGITKMEIEWSNIYGELKNGIYRIVKFNGISTIFSEPFTVK